MPPAAPMKTASSLEDAPSVKTASSVKTDSSVKATSSMKAAARSEVDMIHMMEVMKTIDEDERRAETEIHRRPVKPRVVI